MTTSKQHKYIREATTYHAATEEQGRYYQAINNFAAEFMDCIFRVCPENEDRTDALRKVREARMMANAAIACEPVHIADQPCTHIDDVTHRLHQLTGVVDVYPPAGADNPPQAHRFDSWPSAPTAR